MRQSDDQPLISVIIVNYNYAAFLARCVDSILEQTYPAIELIVVDNASTDHSVNIIENYQLRDPRIQLIRRASNDGQGIACVDGFNVSRGKFIVFVDADDYLLPQFIETHIKVHLSLADPVGMTSSDIIQLSNNRFVVGTWQEFSNFIRSSRFHGEPCLRFNTGSEVSGIRALDDELQHDIYPVRTQSANWVWSPMSGNCFRREILALFIANPALKFLRLEADTYFINGISCLEGSVLIDRPLSVYRIHGGNLWARQPQMNKTVMHERGGPNGLLARKMLIEHLVNHQMLFWKSGLSRKSYRGTLEELSWHTFTHGEPLFLTRLIIANFSKLSKNMGSIPVLLWTLKLAFALR